MEYYFPSFLVVIVVVNVYVLSMGCLIWIISNNRFVTNVLYLFYKLLMTNNFDWGVFLLFFFVRSFINSSNGQTENRR